MGKIHNFRDFATEHEWDYEDEIVAYYITMLKAKHTKFDRDPSSVKETEFNWDDVSNELHKNFALTLDEISEDLIGCSRGAMIANVAVIDFLITDEDKGFTGPNKYQREVVSDFENTPLEELKSKAAVVLDKIWLNKDRINKNYAKKELREEKKQLKKFQKYNKDKSKAEVQSDIKKAKISDNSKPLTDFRHEIDIEVGTEINHSKFGLGKVLSSDGVISDVDFNGTVKKLANKFVDKFKVVNDNKI